MTTLRHAGGSAALLRALRRVRVSRAAERRLAELDDRMLADIGIERCEIGDAVRGRGRFTSIARRD
jgi:uncharacterized protein YjiS (DUF1127 family)